MSEKYNDPRLKSFVALCIKLRKESDLSQSELANIMGRDKQRVQEFEAGEVVPNLLFFLDIIKVLQQQVIFSSQGKIENEEINKLFEKFYIELQSFYIAPKQTKLVQKQINIKL